MDLTVKTIVYFCMIMLMIVSMWTTYASLHDSILPTPLINITLPNGGTWECSVFALMLSVAIGLMLLALKAAIINGQKRLNVLGFVGLFIVAFISIAFNMDVLYRTANRDFYLNYSYNRMRQTYDNYLPKVQAALLERRDTLLKQVARQEGELESEVKGLREKPAGYGSRAREEDYRLTLLQKTNTVEIQTIEQALQAKAQADSLLSIGAPKTIAGIMELQNQIRVAVKDMGAIAAVPLPEPMEFESPFLAVFQNLFDLRKIGLMEVFLLLVSIFLDLGDIVGYSLIPNRPRSQRPYLMTYAEDGRSEAASEIPASLPKRDAVGDSLSLPLADTALETSAVSASSSAGSPPRGPHRIRFGRLWRR